MAGETNPFLCPLFDINVPCYLPPFPGRHITELFFLSLSSLFCTSTYSVRNADHLLLLLCWGWNPGRCLHRNRSSENWKNCQDAKSKGIPESASPLRAWRQRWVLWVQMDGFFRQVAMLWEELTRQHGIHKSTWVIDAWHSTVTWAEQQPCLKSLQGEGKLASNSGLMDSTYKTRETVLLSLLRAEG